MDYDKPPTYEAPVTQPFLPGQLDPLYAQPIGQPMGHPMGQPMGQPMVQPLAPPMVHHMGQPVQQQSVAWTVTTQTNLGPYPITMTCPHCGSEIRTRAEQSTPAMAWILGLVICALG